MPTGLLVLKWNERSGIEILARYPEDIDLKVSKKTLLQVYNMHEYGREAGSAWLTINGVNFTSYFTGPEIGYYIVLVLNILENPEDYEKKLEEVSGLILQNLSNDKYIDLLPILFKKLSIRPSNRNVH